MATTTTRLALRKPAGSDLVNVSTDLDANYDAIDTAAGFTDCTSSTRPSAPFRGQGIRESDTTALLVSNGSSPASASWSYIFSANAPSIFGATGSVAPMQIFTTSTIAGNRVQDFKRQGDANSGHTVDFDGKHQWGPGGATPPDTNLYRNSGGVLKTDGSFTAVGTVTAATVTATTVTANSVSLSSIGRGIIGGRYITGSNNLGSAISSTTEVMPTNMNSGSINLAAGRRYRIHVRYKFQGTVASDNFVMRIYKNSSATVGGTALRQDVKQTINTSLGYTYDMWGEYETSGGAETGVFFVLSAARTATATGNAQFVGGDTGSQNPVGVWVEDVGASGLLTATAS